MDRPAPSAVAVPAHVRTVSHHPLEMIPFFRRWPCGVVRDLIYTFIWNCGIATAFVVAGATFSGSLPTAVQYGYYIAVANFIGYTIHGLFSIGRMLGIDLHARKSGTVVKVAYFSVIPTLGVLLGFQIASVFLDINYGRWYMSPGWIMSVGLTSVVISTILSAIFFWRERDARAQAELERERLRNERVEREAVLANLRALQAQIEPHFLFNTLANVTSLVDPDPAKAKHMLESFIRFLRASLNATRMETTTLGAEGELIAAYLDVLQVRMGQRLRYSIDIPPDLQSHELAPMLLQPVVENAIRHGLEPKMDGGHVAFSASREGRVVKIEISDTGVGFASTTHGGVGLTNLRDRLRGIYGDEATICVGENSPAGTVVTIRIPA